MLCLSTLVGERNEGGSRLVARVFGRLGEQERGAAWSLFFLALYLDVVVAFEVPQLALKTSSLSA